jgi:DNA polymerase-3 subunit epsilon
VLSALRRWRDRRRHGQGPWGALLAPPPEGEWVSLDLETSGLDPARDQVLAIAAVPVRGGVIHLSERFEAVVKPPAALGIDSMRHHRLRPHDLADGLEEREAIEALLRWLGPRALIGYRIGFDAAMLDRHAAAITGFALPNPRHDLAHRWRRRDHARRPDALAGDASFEAIAAALDVPMLARHTALGDAVTAAACWLALEAEAAGVRAGPARR